MGIRLKLVLAPSQFILPFEYLGFFELLLGLVLHLAFDPLSILL